MHQLHVKKKTIINRTVCRRERLRDVFHQNARITGMDWSGNADPCTQESFIRRASERSTRCHGNYIGSITLRHSPI